ncbi:MULTISPECIES: hypothetical protein [Micromonospora]|uniref:Nucleotidyltransferase domain-containing protein n=1 Tax=Micromonospora solifontis TaxID=2487138 RepID=A0ABX9WEA3_9ACTN|nr:MULTISPECIES: hypothetical protein [Micromonospora]NES16549.1 hypothetical protein [Micromonospora sp. PPF5-17B]NES37625.1 hypothetical protein [Micromonospora solifontis]NES58527.1 hypothetical protein [Micromonospora sp. PPF5-6]RNL98155.1 hypothetical protein EFE23_15915 [Micromonospora solifontis]
MTSAVDIRARIAARVAAEFCDDPKVSEVWLEGALGAGLAHARSDIDLRVVFHDQPSALRSRLVDGVRVDLAACTPAMIEPLRSMLGSFDVRFDDVERFRQVRAALGQLTRLRTARRYTLTGWQPAVTGDDVANYRYWAVADRVEHVLSLVEDLLGLTTDHLYAEAEVVRRQLEICLLGLDVVAAGQPLLGDKWLPALWRRANDGPPPSLLAPCWNADDTSWFPSVRKRVIAALLRCWPDRTTAEEPPPAGTGELGWLPQRYTDGWFLRCGDERIRLTPGQLTGWHRANRQGG